MTNNPPDPDYPVVRLIARHSGAIALVVALGLLCLAVLAAIEGAAVWVVLLLVGGAAIGYVLLRSYGELVRILLDILLPQ